MFGKILHPVYTPEVINSFNSKGFYSSTYQKNGVNASRAYDLDLDLFLKSTTVGNLNEMQFHGSV